MSAGPYFIGNSARFSCEEGFEIKGDDIITCLPSQTWSSDLPTCERKFTIFNIATLARVYLPTGVCGPLQQISNSSVVVSSFFIEGEAIYQCNEGYHFSPLQRDDMVKFCCLPAEDGDHLEWVGGHHELPDCQRKEIASCFSTLKVAPQYDTTPTQARRKNRNNFYSCVRGRRFGRRPHTEVPFVSYCEAAFSY